MKREDIVGQKVATTNLDWIDAEFEGRLIDESFEERSGLWPASAAVRPHRGGVRDGNRDVELQLGDCVGALRHVAGQAWQHRADVRVGTAVVDQTNTQAGESAVFGATQLGVLHLASAVQERFHVVTAWRYPGDWPLELACQRTDRDVFGHQSGFAAEATADLWRHHVHVGFFEAECPGQLPVQEVRHLR